MRLFQLIALAAITAFIIVLVSVMSQYRPAPPSGSDPMIASTSDPVRPSIPVENTATFTLEPNQPYPLTP